MLRERLACRGLCFPNTRASGRPDGLSRAIQVRSQRASTSSARAGPVARWHDGCFALGRGRAVMASLSAKPKATRGIRTGSSPRRVERRERGAVRREPEGSTEVARAFGRRGAQHDGWIPTDFGCPDCRGVLFVAVLGKRGWLSFRCRVGHGFAADTLLAAKENQLEQSLWGAVEVLDELVQLYGVLAQRRGKGRAAPVELSLTERGGAAESQRRALLRLLEAERLPARARRERSGP